MIASQIPDSFKQFLCTSCRCFTDFFEVNVGKELGAVESRVDQHSTFDLKYSDIIRLDEFGKYNIN